MNFICLLFEIYLAFAKLFVYTAYMNKLSNLRNTPQLVPGLKTLFFSKLANNVSVITLIVVLKVAKSTLYKWAKDIREKGAAALMPMKRGRKVGTGRILSPKEEQKIQRLIISNLPTFYNLCFSSWTRKAVTELILLKCGKTIAVRTAGDYLKRWDFTPQQPKRQAYQRVPEKVQEWLTSGFKKIQASARKIGATIFFGDEAGVHTENFKARSYAPKGKTPVIPTTGSRLVKNFIAAISNLGQLRYKTYFGSMNCKIFISFLKDLVKSANGKTVFLIVDNLKVHHGKMVTEWLKLHTQIKLFFLPPYCPDLNPEEYLNNVLKNMIHSRPQPETKEELSELLGTTLHSLQKSPDKISRLFENKNIKYASRRE